MNKKNNKIFNGVKDFFKLKSWLKLGVIIIAGVSLATLITHFEFKNSEEIARAGSSDNVYGFAWAETVGWISFNKIDCSNANYKICRKVGTKEIFNYRCSGDSPNCVSEGGECVGWCNICDDDAEVICDDDADCDTGSCVNMDYGANIDSSTRDFSGYAWSPSIGWVCLGETCQTAYDSNFKVCSNDYSLICIDSSDCGGASCDYWNPDVSPDNSLAEATYVNDEISGWGNILSLGNNGWISFNTTATPDYGVSIASSTGEFSGWAWNGNDNATTIGIGWISFNCSDTSSCATVDYKVTTDVNTLPTAINLSAPNWSYANACNLSPLRALLRWEFSDSDVGATQTAYQVVVDDDSDMADPLVDTREESTASQYIFEPPILQYDTIYYWWVKVWDDKEAESEWVQYDSATDTQNDDGNNLTFTIAKHDFPDTDFSYLPVSPSQGEEAQFLGTATAYGGASITDWLWSADDATFDPDTATSSPIITFGSSGSNTVTLQATDSDGYYCSASKNVNVNMSLPSWQEIKPR